MLASGDETIWQYHMRQEILKILFDGPLVNCLRDLEFGDPQSAEDLRSGDLPNLTLGVTPHLELVCVVRSGERGRPVLGVGFRSKGGDRITVISELRVPEECDDGYLHLAMMRTMDEVAFHQQWGEAQIVGLDFGWFLVDRGRRLYKKARCSECSAYEPVAYCCGYEGPCNRFFCKDHLGSTVEVGEGLWYQTIRACHQHFGRAMDDLAVRRTEAELRARKKSLMSRILRCTSVEESSPDRVAQERNALAGNPQVVLKCLRHWYDSQRHRVWKRE